MKRTLFKWLPVLLAAVLLTGLIVLPVSADGECRGHHSWGPSKMAVEDTCYYGKCEATSQTCTVCGAKRYIIFRPLQGQGFEKTGGTHTWVTSEYDSECPSHKTVEKRCSVCGAVETTLGGHNWTEGAIVGSSTCTGGGTRVDTCSYCQEKITVNVPTRGNHTWAVKETVEPTCTQNGYQVVICTVCQTESTVATNMKATGHRWVADGGDCGAGRHCEKCGAVEAATGHAFGSTWRYDSSKHWLQCANCSATTSEYAHDFVGDKCDTCGYTRPANDPARCSHTWKIVGKTSTFTHKELCSKCGAERSVNCSESTMMNPRQYCTEDLYCQCGNLAKEGQKNHNYGTWLGSQAAHEKKCLNPGCNETVTAQHELTTISKAGYTDYQCTVCGVVARSVKNDAATPDTPPVEQHTHSFGAWISDGADQHVRICNGHGCTEKETEAHTLGEPDCQGNAVCTKCGAAVKTDKAGSNHVGGTKIVGEKAATATEAGYTGDTVCVGCGAVLIEGMTRPALQAAHTHVYNILRHDTEGHWHECSCGDKGPVEAHTGGTATCASGAKCALCGEVYGEKSNVHVGGTKVTNAKSAKVGVDGYTGDTCCVGCGAVLLPGESIPALKGEHTHTYETAKHDSTGHWTECQCGAKKAVEQHTFQEGICTVCGEKEPMAVEAHVHSYEAEWKGDSTHHWHVCESCGLEADKAVHAFVNGKCLDCGMTVEVKEEKEAEEEKTKVEAEASRVNAVEQFNDVKESDWFAKDVQKVLDRQIMKGTGVAGNTFSPYKATTRRELVTILARASGIDTTPGNNPWYYPGLAWATALGVNEGYPDAEGDKNITRSELVVMMYRTAGKPAAAENKLGAFTDASTLTGEVKEAFNWAVSAGVIDGKPNHKLAPEDTTNRAEIAAVVARYLKYKGL